MNRCPSGSAVFRGVSLVAGADQHIGAQQAKVAVISNHENTSGFEVLRRSPLLLAKTGYLSWHDNPSRKTLRVLWGVYPMDFSGRGSIVLLSLWRHMKS
jgi:hypothetical protein